MSKLTTSEIQNLDQSIDLLYEGKQIAENEVKFLCEKAQEILQLESNV